MFFKIYGQLNVMNKEFFKWGVFNNMQMSLNSTHWTFNLYYEIEVVMTAVWQQRGAAALRAQEYQKKKRM